MTDEPGGDRFRVSLVLDMEIKKARRDASFARLVGSTARHGHASQQDTDLDERGTETGLGLAKQS